MQISTRSKMKKQSVLEAQLEHLLCQNGLSKASWWGPAGDADYTDHCKLDEVRAREIVVDAVNIEREFAFDLLLVALVGLNGVLTSQYIKSTITYCLPMELWVQRMRYPASHLQHVRHNAITAASPWLCAQPSDHLLSTRVIPHGTPTRATYLSTARSGTSPTPCF